MIQEETADEAYRVLTLTGELTPDGWVRLPVDPARIAGKLGLEVYQAQLGEGVGGALIKRPDADPIILLNEADHSHRQRFTCAHEIGHFVQRQDRDEYEYIDKRDQLSWRGADAKEVFANGFAAALLMPAKEVRNYWTSGARDWELAAIFDVSAEAMSNRLNALGLT